MGQHWATIANWSAPETRRPVSALVTINRDEISSLLGEHRQWQRS